MRRLRARSVFFGAIAAAALVRFFFLVAHHRALPSTTSSSSSSSSSSVRDRRILAGDRKAKPEDDPDKDDKSTWPRYEPTSDGERLWLGLSLYDDYEDGGGVAEAIARANGDAEALSAMATAQAPPDKVEAEVLCDEEQEERRCDSLRIALESLSGLRLKVVRGRLSPCRDDERRPPPAAVLARRRQAGKPDPPPPPSCAEWARKGQCLEQPRESLRRCAATCGFCTSGKDEEEEEEEEDNETRRGFWARALKRRRRRRRKGETSSSSNNTNNKNPPPKPCRDAVSACPLLARAGRCALLDNTPNELNLVALSCARSCGKCGRDPLKRAEVEKTALAAAASITGQGAVLNLGIPGYNDPPAPATERWGPCEDKHARCGEWASKGECGKNADWMGRHCGVTCGRCVTDADGGWAPAISRAVATGAPLQLLRALGETEEERLAAEAEGFSPDARDERERLAREAPQRAEEYDAEDVALVGQGCELPDEGGGSKDNSTKDKDDCRAPLVPAGVPGCADREAPARCAEWASSGECDSNADYMSRRCASTCGQCWSYRTEKGASLAALRLGWRRRGRKGGGGGNGHGNAGPLLPTVGFGTAGLGGDGGTRRAVRQALELGYGMVDTACAREWYRQDEVGEALRERASAAAARGGGGEGGDDATTTATQTPFLVTKIHPRDLGYNATLAAAHEALRELGVASLGLLLLHYPRCWEGVRGCAGHLPPAALSRKETGALWRESWRALMRLRDEEKVVEAIGVSNFALDEFRELLAMAEVGGEGERGRGVGGGGNGNGAAADQDQQPLPFAPGPRPTNVDAVEVRLDPLDASTAVVVREALHRGVAVLAYSTLGTQHPGARGGGGGGSGKAAKNPVLSSPVLARVGKELGGRSTAQVALRWALQRGAVVIPASSSAAHAAENLQLRDFKLTDAQMDAVDGLPWADLVVKEGKEEGKEDEEVKGVAAAVEAEEEGREEQQGADVAVEAEAEEEEEAGAVGGAVPAFD
jgi:diketogulonate reductase-like aldo/keto reductase